MRLPEHLGTVRFLTINLLTHPQPTDQATLSLAAELKGLGLSDDQALKAAEALKKYFGVTALADLSVLDKADIDQVAATLTKVAAIKLTAAWEKV